MTEPAQAPAGAPPAALNLDGLLPRDAEPAEQGRPVGGTGTEYLRAEVARIMTDKTHPMHAGYRQRDPKVQAYIDDRYRKAYGTAPVEVGQGQGIEVVARPQVPPAAPAPGQTDFLPSPGAPAPGESSPDDAAFRTQVASAVQERGVDLAPVQTEGARLFAGAEGDAALMMIENRALSSLRPAAEVRAHVVMAEYLADLHRIRSSPADASASAGGESAQLDAALRETFGGSYASARRTIDATLQDMFAGPDGKQARDGLERRLLDGLTPAQRVHAKVRSARALVALGELRQWQS